MTKPTAGYNRTVPRVLPTPCEALQAWSEINRMFLGIGLEWVGLLLTRGDRE